MSYITIPEELLQVDISAAQLRLLIHLMNNTYSSGKYAGCCCLGYQNLADLCFTHKGAAINTIKQLENLGFIEINRREKFNRSNAIRLTLENGYERCRVQSSGDCPDNSERSLNRTDDGSLNRTDERSLNRTLGSLNRTLGSLNRTPYIDLNFKNLNLKNNNAREGSLNDTFEKENEREQIAFSGVAENRSISDCGQAAESSAKKSCVDGAGLKAQDLYILEAVKAKFTDVFDDLSLSRAGDTYILRKKGKFALIENVRLVEVAEWLKSAGLQVLVGEHNSRIAGEFLIGEVI